jgi:hypothetical protein
MAPNPEIATVRGAVDAAVKSADTARKGITLSGVAIGAGGGALITAFSFQGMVDRMAADLGIGGVVMFILLMGSVLFIVFLFRFIFMQWRETSMTGQAQAAATVQSALAEASTAEEIKSLKAIMNSIDLRMAALDQDMRNSTVSNANLSEAFAKLRSEVAGMVRRIDSIMAAGQRK